MVLIGNKSDLEREVSFDEAMTWANNNNMGYFEISSKMGDNVNEVFEFAIAKCYRRFKHEKPI